MIVSAIVLVSVLVVGESVSDLGVRMESVREADSQTYLSALAGGARNPGGISD